jgi:gamma-glutamyltranspeptidase/glutathione hydrolase
VLVPTLGPQYGSRVRGAIAAGHPLTAEAGARVLRDGGNAVDALLAAAFTAFVTEGPLTGPTGGGFALVHEPSGTTTMLDCFFAVPTRPLGEMEELLIDFGDAGTQVFHVGEGSVAVPGLLAGLEELHERFATTEWTPLVDHAIAVARKGFERDEQRVFLHAILQGILQRDEGGRAIYGDPARVRTEAICATLERVRGERAAMVAGLLPELASDLAAYRVLETEPLELEILGREIRSMPSQGGGVVQRILELLAAHEGDPLLEAEARAVADAYGPLGSGPLPGTTHISVVDADGLAAGLSSTLGSGSGVFRGGTQLNNMLGELDVIGRGPRAPGERLPSMMTPTLVLEDARPQLVIGSAGSVRLAGAIAQVTWRFLRGMHVADAIRAPRLHVEGATVHLEGGWPDADVDRLPASWDVNRWDGLNLFFGGVQAVEHTAEGSFLAAGDPRRGGAGIVVA